MIQVHRPARDDVDRFRHRQADLPFSYAPVGGSRADPPGGFNVDHNRIQLGRGRDAFDHAVAAVRRWEMFNIGWVTLCWPETHIEVGQTVGVLIPLYGLWVLNACRIVYGIDDDEGDVRRFGFAYGTLPDHMESGEERFAVEWRREDDSVWYDLLAFSLPRHPLARLGAPLSRRLQRRFARDSLHAMIRAARAM